MIFPFFLHVSKVETRVCVLKEFRGENLHICSHHSTWFFSQAGMADVLTEPSGL